jgi:4-hydroxy-3-methylbut-2-enyl diphosphate reductase
MEIIVAKSAGFCFGVDRAVKSVNELLATQNAPVYTYGEIIHNPTVVREFESRGVQVIESLDELDTLEKGTIVIRSHGVTEAEEQLMNQSGFDVKNSTCPYVSKIHRIVAKASELGQDIIIVGNPKHPEIIGIAGWAKTKVYIIEGSQDVETLTFDHNKTYAVVAQTTFNHNLYKEIIKKLQNRNIRVIINETICQATWIRQVEAKELSAKVDKMIVIGGKNSSNTRKLFEICQDQCKETYYIETIEDLVLNCFTVSDIIGITAGASTPKKIIEEVISNVRNAKF